MVAKTLPPSDRTDVLRERRRRNQARFYARVRDELVAAYGSKCVCCGETERPFLTIDHELGDGAAHKRALGGGGGYAVWLDLKRRGWPQQGYRLLCMNCQFGTRYGRTCPHRAVGL